MYRKESVDTDEEYESSEFYVESCDYCTQNDTMGGMSLMVRVPDLSLEPGEMDWYCPKCSRRE